MSMIRKFSDFVFSLKYEDLPEEVVERASLCLLDAIGNLLAGEALHGKAPYILKFLQMNKDSRQESTVPGAGKFSCETAAFTNAVLLRSLDLDDGHRVAMGHPGSTLVPTVLAAAEKYGKSGKDVITALVAGYDAYVRIGSVVYPYAYNAKGFEGTATNGAIANTAAVGKLTGLSAESMANAMGMAATFTGALIEYQHDSTSGKELCAALASLDAFRAVDLANAGFTGPAKILEGPKGFFQAFGPGMTDADPFNDLGETFGIMSVYFKIHACMRGVHAAVDAALRIRKSSKFSLDKVEKAVIRASSFVKRLVKKHPENEADCQSNLFYCVGVALLHGVIDSGSLDSGMNDERIRSFEERCQFICDDEIENYVKANPSHWGASIVELHMPDGTTLTERQNLAEGEPELPFERGVLENKFERLLSGTRWSSSTKYLQGACQGACLLDPLVKDTLKGILQGACPLDP